jgi:endonuclease VIII
MPEGDTIAWAAKRIRPVLVGQIPDEIRTPQLRHRRDRWAERLAGREVERVETHGKHLFIRFGPRAGQPESLYLHSHLGMVGRWLVAAEPQPWRNAWIVLRVDARWVVELRGPTLELLTDGRRRFDQRLAALGPDILSEPFDFERFLRRVRLDDPRRPLGDALLDQTILAGVGNVWKAEGCWEVETDPWRALSTLSDEELVAIVEALRPRMRDSAEHGPRAISPRVYGRAGRPCPRCGERVHSRGQGDANRTTYWCPGCQR